MENCHQEMTDKELARAVASGGRAEFDEIVRRYCGPLTMFAVGKTRTFQDAEDIVQETFLRVYQNINSFDSKYSFENWLFTIAYRIIVSGYRKKQPQRLRDKASAQLAADEPERQDNQWVWGAAREMGIEAYTVLWLRYKRGMSTSEIAKVMKKTKITVRVLLHRSRVRLMKQITEQPETAERSRWIRGGAVFIERTK
jgi:RNA polymerase sigma-70 factor (ECF subfamily)